MDTPNVVIPGNEKPEKNHNGLPSVYLLYPPLLLSPKACTDGEEGKSSRRLTDSEVGHSYRE